MSGSWSREVDRPKCCVRDTALTHSLPPSPRPSGAQGVGLAPALMANRAPPPPTRGLSPPPSPSSFRRSPTPEPITTYSALRGEERQRSNSFDATLRPRTLQRSPQPDSAASSQRTVYGGGIGGTLPPPPKEYALSVQEGSGRSSPASLRSAGPIATPSTSTSTFGGPRSFRAATSPSQGSTLGASPVLKGLDSYNSRNVAAALEGGGTERQLDDVWQSVCVRVLPLLCVQRS